MPDVNAILQSQFLRAEDLGGKPRRVIITAAPIEMIGQGEKAQQKVVLSIQGTKKRLPLNRINTEMCKSLFSHISENWVGKQIELRPERVMFSGQMVPAIRIYPAPPAAAAPAVAAPAPIAPAAPVAEAPADAGDAWEAEAAEQEALTDGLPWQS